MVQTPPASPSGADIGLNHPVTLLDSRPKTRIIVPSACQSGSSNGTFGENVRRRRRPRFRGEVVGGRRQTPGGTWMLPSTSTSCSASSSSSTLAAPSRNTSTGSRWTRPPIRRTVTSTPSRMVLGAEERPPGYISSEAFVAYSNAPPAGTKMPRTNRTGMARYSIVAPPTEVADPFRQLTEPLIDRIIGNVHEPRTLAAIRDSVLPRLRSGKLRPAVTETSRIRT
jgi:hypothetical protein